MPVDPHVATLLQMMAAAPQLSDGTPEQARAAIRMLMVNFRDVSALPEVASVEDATVGNGIPVRVYRPRAGGTVSTIVYLHGGGFVIGDLETHDGVCRRLCHDTGSVVVSGDYRLAPEAPFTAAVDDAWAALQHVHDHIADYGGDPERLAVGGDSAGATLAAVCAQQAHAEGLPLRAQLLVYPAVDLLGEFPSRTENAEGYFLTLADMEWFAGHYTGVAGGAAALADPATAELAADPRLSPLRAKDLSGLAPAVVVTAQYDPLRDEGDAYAEALTTAHVTVRHRQFPGLIHGFYGLEQFSPAIADATAWINASLRELLG